MDNLGINWQLINTRFCGHRRLEILYKCVPKSILAGEQVDQRVIRIYCTMEIYLLPFGSASDHMNLLVICETARQKFYAKLTYSGERNVLVYSFVEDIKLQNFQIDFLRNYTRIKTVCILGNWFSPVGCAPDNFGINCPHFIVMNTNIAMIFMNQIQALLSSTNFKSVVCTRDQATQTFDGDKEFEKCPDGLNYETEKNNRMLVEENVALKQQLLENDEVIKEMKSQFAIQKRKCFKMKYEYSIEIKNISEEKISLENKLQQLKDINGNLQKEYEDTLLDFGRLSVESDSKTNLGKKSETFQKLFSPKLSESLVVNMAGNSSSHFSHWSTINSDVQPNSVQSEDEQKPLLALSLPSPSGEQFVGADGELVVLNACQGDNKSKGFEAQSQNQGSNVRPNNESIEVSPPFPTEVHERSNAQPLGLINELSTSVNAHVYNIYRLLLLTISDRLLYSDIIKLKEWANDKFTVDSNLSAAKVILQLDQKGAINASDLGQLRLFFESITRFDLVYLIDEFYDGDYNKLRKLINQHKSINISHERVANINRVHSSRVLLPHNSTPRSLLRSNPVNRVSNVEVFERPSKADENNGVSIVRNPHVPHSNVASTSNSIVISGSRCSTYENSEDVPDCPAVNNTRGYAGGENMVSTNDAPVTTTKIGNKLSNIGQPSSQTRPKSREPSSHDAQNRPAQYNGSSQRHPDDHFHGPRNGNLQDNWLCNHYKRRCLVKFECCNKYWACHRCHNNESTCGRKKLKSRDTTMVKCVECGKEQQFGENGQFCVSCDTQFANFYCGLCKHLTGNDDHPYHCDKCGIC
ncbi:RING finger and CHY zinc finger domain-containing 1, partial [Paramuricea clavata]